MNNEHQVLEHDLKILEAMAAEMEDYLLRSEVTQWTLAGLDTPKLTIGGYLMRQHRLQALRDRLTSSEQSRLDAAVERFEQALVEKVVRFEHRVHQELHTRLGEWGGCLRNLSHQMEVDPSYYASVVDTRVVITAMIDKLKNPPYRLDKQIINEVTVLDRNLRSRWQPGEFVWLSLWQPAYPPEKYWWLYGTPKK